jgi:lantibiotic leader peptide-processing serine protease
VLPHTRARRALLATASALAVLILAAPASAASRYVVVFKSGHTKAGVAAIRDAGGRVVDVNRKIGVATAVTSRTGFLRAVRQSRAIKVAGRDTYYKQPKLRPQRARAAADQPVVPAPDAETGCAGQYGVPAAFGPEPLSVCQWDMRVHNATTTGSYAVNQGEGATVGIIDTGLDMSHPDIAPNLDLAKSCSFIRPGTPTSVPQEQATDCSQKSAVQDYAGHGTHVGGTVAAPINAFGVSGVAPQAKLAGLHAGTAEGGYFFVQPVVDALTWAGDQHIDVVNMSFFVDPYLYNCRNSADQRANIEAIRRASAYAAQRGVVQVAAAGNETDDLNHPTDDPLSPDYPPDAAVDRPVHNNCIVLPTELPHVAVVSAVGPQKKLSFYSSYGNIVDFAAAGGSSTQAPNPYGRVLNAWSSTAILDPADPLLTQPKRRVEDCETVGGAPVCALYVWIQGTSMASPHAAGVAALIRAAHPGLSPDAVIALEARTAMPNACPGPPDPGYALLDPPRSTPPACKGSASNNNLTGSGLVDALAAGQ